MPSVLNTISRGLVGYISYLATCRSSTAYSEYLLYEPTLRIAKSQGYEVECEYRVTDLKKARGSYPKIDFYLWKSGCNDIALELKWAKKNPVNIESDVKKLEHLRDTYSGVDTAILIFGNSSVIDDLRFSNNRTLKQSGATVKWQAGRTSYGARYYLVT